MVSCGLGYPYVSVSGYSVGLGYPSVCVCVRVIAYVRACVRACALSCGYELFSVSVCVCLANFNVFGTNMYCISGCVVSVYV